MLDEISCLLYHFCLFNLISVVRRIGRFKPRTVHLMLSLVVVFISPTSATPVNGQDLMMVTCGSELCNIINQYCDTQVSQCTPCAPLCSYSDEEHQSSCRTHCRGYLVSQNLKQSLISAVGYPIVIGIIILMLLASIAGNIFQCFHPIKLPCACKKEVQKAQKSVEVTPLSDPAAQPLLSVSEPTPVSSPPPPPPPPASMEVTSVPRAGHNPTDSAGMSLNDSGYPSLNTEPSSLEGSISTRPDQ